MRCGHVAVAVLLALTASAANGAPVADYALQNSLASAIAGAPDLAKAGTGTTGFTTESVNGNAQTVFTFSAGIGLSLSPTTTILSNPGVYTIRLLTRHDSSGYVKYIDFMNLGVDVGLYDDNGHLNLYPEGEGSNQNIGSGYNDVVLTRDANGIARGYLNGVLQFIDDDSVHASGVISNANTLYFFLDDTVSSSEVANGAVARITIWDSVLGAQEVAALEPDLIFADEFDEGGP